MWMVRGGSLARPSSLMKLDAAGGPPLGAGGPLPSFWTQFFPVPARSDREGPRWHGAPTAASKREAGHINKTVHTNSRPMRTVVQPQKPEPPTFEGKKVTLSVSLPYQLVASLNKSPNRSRALEELVAIGIRAQKGKPPRWPDDHECPVPPPHTCPPQKVPRWADDHECQDVFEGVTRGHPLLYQHGGKYFEVKVINRDTYERA